MDRTLTLTLASISLVGFVTAVVGVLWGLAA